MTDIVDIAIDAVIDTVTLEDVERGINEAYAAYVFRASVVFQALYNAVEWD